VKQRAIKTINYESFLQLSFGFNKGHGMMLRSHLVFLCGGMNGLWRWEGA
jgi:hypothetical protein